METKHKQFKPFDRILRRDHEDVWQPDLYGFWDKCRDRHQSMLDACVDDEDILPYEGNEELIGTTDEPDGEVRLGKGEWVMCAVGVYNDASDWVLRQFDQTREKTFLTVNGGY